MQFTHKTVSSAPADIGVYAIKNTLNGKSYIGSAAQFNRKGRGLRWRWNEHLRDLRAGKHHSQKLQRAWIKYGADAFVFEVLEVIEPCGDSTREVVLQAEQRHIDARGVRNGYNVNPTAGSQLGYRHSDETKGKISKKTRGVKKSPETIARMKEAWVAKKAAGFTTSDEVREKMRAAALRRMADPDRRAALAAIGREASARNKGVKGRKGTKWSDETREKILEAHARRLADPARTAPHREAMAARRGIPLSPETKEKMRLASIERSKNPEYIKRMGGGVRKAHARRKAEGIPPEAVEKMRLAAIERSKDPEYRKRLSEAAKKRWAKQKALEAVGG